MKLNIVISLIFGALFVWLAVSGVDFGVLQDALATMDYLPLIPFVILVLIYYCLRVWRWGLILGKDYPVSFRTLFSVNAVGFLAINLLPARLGEFARPYLLLEKEDVPFGAGMASIVIERMLDFLTMLLILALVIFAIDLPTTSVEIRGTHYDFISVVRQVFLLVAVPAVGGLVGLMIAEPFMYKILHGTVGRIMPGVAALMESFFRSFMKSLRPLKNPKLLAIQVALTLVIWTVTPITEWLMFKVFHLNHLGMDASLTVVATLLLGMLVPAPPGFAGNFEAATMAGLGIYGVTGGIALGYALMLHWLQFLITCVMGMYFLYKDGISFRALIRFAKDVKAGIRNAESG